MNALDRTIIKLGFLALAICGVGLLGAESPAANKKGPAPLHVTLRRAPPCVPGAANAPVTALRGDPDAIAPVPGPCAAPVSERDANAALARLREDLSRIQVLKEAAAGRGAR